MTVHTRWVVAVVELALMGQSPGSAVVGQERKNLRAELEGGTAEPCATGEEEGACGPVCFARALVSTIDEMGPDMLLHR